MFRKIFRVWMRLGPVVIDGRYIFLPGVVVNGDNALNFNRDADEAYVNSNWSDNQWNDNTVVAFRDCSALA